MNKNPWCESETVKRVKLGRNLTLRLVREIQEIPGGHRCRLAVRVEGPVSTLKQVEKVNEELGWLLTSEDP